MRDAGNYYRQYESLKIVLVAIRESDNEVVYCLKWPPQATWHTREELASSVPVDQLEQAEMELLSRNKRT